MTDSNSVIRDREITQSVERLNRVVSEGRFRIRSYRAKTISHEVEAKLKLAAEHDYHDLLLKAGFSDAFLRQLYQTKSEEATIPISQQKFRVFLRFLYQKLSKTKQLELNTFNFQRKSAQMFLAALVKINRQTATSGSDAGFYPIIAYNLSCCQYLTCNHDETTANLQSAMQTDEIVKIICNEKNIVKLQLKNMGLNYYDIKVILESVNKVQRIFEINLSNESSQTMNRLGASTDLLFDFLMNNKTTAIIKLDNLCLRKQGVEQIYKGISQCLKTNPLKILCLKNNGITEAASLSITMIARSGLLFLDLSENPLSPNFFLALSSWKTSTLQSLDLTMTGMNSEALIFFLDKLQENKSLQYLKADNNDFSHHWFNQTKSVLEANTSLEVLSMVNCRIKRLCETFKGLHYNRYLKKINLSNNSFHEGSEELGSMLVANKVLQEIRIRNCGLNPTELLAIIKSLAFNEALLILDISENHLGEEAATQMIKVLNSNKSLLQLGCQKVQIPYRIKKQIEDKITSNQAIRKQEQYRKLKQENVRYKQDDVASWEHIESMEKICRLNAQNIKIASKRVKDLEKQEEKRKAKFTIVIKQCKNRENQLSAQIDGLKDKFRNLQKQEAKTLQLFERREKKIVESCQQEQMLISQLQQSIVKQSQKNMKRENQLEQALQNRKYLKKKMNSKYPFLKNGFDPSTALGGSRKRNAK